MENANYYESPKTNESDAGSGNTNASTATIKEPSKGSLLVLFLVVFIDLLGFGMVLPLLPNYALKFQQDSSGLVLGLLMSSFSAMQFLFAPWWGRISDRVGRRPVLIIGLLGSVVFYTLFGIATTMESLTLLFVARIGAGIAGATIPITQAYIADCTSQQGRARGMALIGAAFGLGFTFGPLFGYFAVTSETDNPGPGPGYAAAALSAFAIVLALFKLPESLDRKIRAQNINTPRHGWSNWSAWGDAFRIPTMGGLLITLFICVLGFASFETTLSVLLKGKIRGEVLDTPFKFTYQQVLLTFAYIGFTLLIAQGVIVRRIAHRVLEKKMASFGACLQFLGYIGMCMAIQRSSVPMLIISLTVVTVGFSFVTPSLHGLISRRTDESQQGKVLGIAQSLSALSRIFGPIFGMMLIKHDLNYPYYFAITLLFIGLLMILQLKEQPNAPAGDRH